MKIRASTFALLALGAACACQKPKPDEKRAPTPSATPSVTPAPAEAAALSGALGSADLRVEARRGTASVTDPILVRHQPQIDAHFGKAPRAPLAFQVVTTGSGHSAVLLQSTQGEPRPLVWLLDANGEILWAKEHPLGGIKPGISEPSLAAGPDGHVCIAWCNASTDSVALRRWAEDGGAFADYDAFHVDGCEALSALYWPKRGWVLGAAYKGGATLELIDENGGRAWGNDGLAMPWTWTAAAPVSFALDTQDSLLVFRIGQSGGAGSGAYVFATRWSLDGRPMWPGPLSLKRLPGSLVDPLSRVAAEPGPEGTIRASLSPSMMKTPPGNTESVVVDVASDGNVTRR